MLHADGALEPAIARRAPSRRAACQRRGAMPVRRPGRCARVAPRRLLVAGCPGAIATPEGAPIPRKPDGSAPEAHSRAGSQACRVEDLVCSTRPPPRCTPARRPVARRRGWPSLAWAPRCSRPAGSAGGSPIRHGARQSAGAVRPGDRSPLLEARSPRRSGGGSSGFEPALGTGHRQVPPPSDPRWPRGRAASEGTVNTGPS